MSTKGAWIGWVAIAMTLFPACRRDEPRGSSTDGRTSSGPTITSGRAPSLEPAASAKTGPSSERVSAPHLAPTGTLAGKPFSPDVVILVQNGGAMTLGLYQRKEREKKRERWRCEDPLGDVERQVTFARKAEDWKPGAKLSIEPGEWVPGDGAATGAATPTISISKTDVLQLSVEGSLELTSPDGAYKVSGPFKGDFCPTKVVPRESPPPLSGLPWSLDPVAPEKIPDVPLTAIVAGAPATPVHATIRERERLGKRVTEIDFYRDKPKDPCMERPRGGWLTSYGDDGRITSRQGPTASIDSFALYLPSSPKAGDALVGFKTGDKEQASAILDADLQVFEPDLYRSWTYSQYYSAALSIEAADDSSVRGRVYLAVPDSGKSQLVGRFEAKRCPALP